MTLLEVVFAMMLVGVTVAAGVAAVDVVADARDRIDEGDLAAEVANDVLLKAEAFGCGLPVGHNEVTAAERLAGCVYDTAVGAAGLADVDYTARRAEREFTVALRMEWNLLEPPPAGYQSSVNACLRQARYASNTPSNPADANVDPTRAAQPTVLTRTVSVTSEDGVAVSLTSRQAVLPHLAPPAAVLGLLVFESGLEGRAATLQRTIGGINYSYSLHGDSDDCAWHPYLEGADYTLKITGSPDRGFGPLSCADSGVTGVCHRYSS